jgi:carnosine N-methyltransferase
MLMASNLALNELRPSTPYVLHPYIHSMSHRVRTADLLRSVTLPDIDPPAELHQSDTKGGMSMVAGDFSECYSFEENNGTFNVVITVFFLDTAPNVLKYLETIWNVLAPGGWWINIGPLAWHFESDDSPGKPPGTIELTLEELVLAARTLGFAFIENEGLATQRLNMPYMGDEKAMLSYIYETEFWVATKPI